MRKLSRKEKIYFSLALVSTILIITVAIIGVGMYRVFYNPAYLFREDFNRAADSGEPFKERVVNIVIIGLGQGSGELKDQSGYLADTIMVASINFDRNSLTLLSIPRDSYVIIAGTGKMERIRLAYRMGRGAGGEEDNRQGIDCILKSVETLLGRVRLHYYIAVDMKGLEQLIDSMGGVEFDVEMMIPGPTPAEDLYVGPQLLDGRAYMQYLTYVDSDTGDDLMRIERQKKLLLATLNHFKQMKRFSQVIPTYQAYQDSLDTDLQLDQIISLVAFAREHLNISAVNDYTLQGEYIDGGDEKRLILDDEANVAIIKEVFSLK